MTLFCSVVGCFGRAVARGICNAHYHDYRRSKKMKPCACGCGEQTSHTFKWGHHTRLFTSEEQSRRGRQNDGSALRDRGTADWYRKVGQRHEHRTVMERKLGRPLSPSEIVHHKDENKKNNKPWNLELMTRAEHMQHHIHDKRKRRGA